MEVKLKTTGNLKRKWTSTSPPLPVPPPSLLLRYNWATAKPSSSVKGIMRSVTKQAIANFWRQKRMVEEDHLLAALKAAARIKARNLTEEDYRCFEESLKENTSKDDKHKDNKKDENSWWTKSKYAYLNQPAIESMEAPKRTSTYIHKFCFYKAPAL